MNKNRSALALLIFGSLAGCETTGRIDIYTACDNPCGNGMPGYTCGSPCNTCTGACLTLPPLGFDNPTLLWIGSDPIAPACPARAPRNVFEGFADPNEGYECPACLCEAPSCELPPGLQTSGSDICEGPDFATFDAPTPWNGACTAPTAVAPSELNSILIPPPTVSDCTPTVDSAPQLRDLSPPWKTYARACKGEAVPNACGDPGKTCMPISDLPPPGFSQCILYLREGDADCPADYPDKHVLYSKFQDTRRCTACECGPPEGSACTALVSAYDDPSCTTLLGAETLTLAGPKCVGGPGMQLVSMEAEWIANKPGTCAPAGGEPVGQLTPTSPSIFCCQASPL